jgi:CubicO group peptidase (beta-lactamase class C family)
MYIASTMNPANVYAHPLDIGDGWSTADPAQVGFGSDQLNAVIDNAGRNQSNTHGIVIERHGKLIAERYFAGRDHPHDSWAGENLEFGPASKHDLRSVGKSITSLLFGIARQQGKIGKLTTPVLDFFPEYKDLQTSQKRAITLQHLLTMSTGLRWSESGGRLVNQETQMNWAWDRYHYVLKQDMIQAPGSQFNYNSGANALLAEIIERRSSMSFATYAYTQLFKPLGITDIEWDTDYRGKAMSFSGLRMRPRDLVKIGRLVLDHGKWHGQQIVPEDWLQESLAHHIVAEDGMEYGYQWWIGRAGKISWVAAIGLGGQALYIVPEFDMTVVITAGRYSSSNSGDATYQLFQRILETLNKR